MPRIILTLFLITTTAHAQFTLHDAHTTADLRGIDNVGGGVAWASGTDGTILRTEDAGFVWQLCAKPPNGEHLDFRAIQAFDNNTAIIMSSGKGDLSRLYKTTDGCQHWTLLFTNPDKDGFWDALQITHTIPKDIGTLFILGDPVDRQFRFFENDSDGRDPEFSAFEGKGESWTSFKQKGLEANPESQGAFAASNTALNTGDTRRVWSFFGTGGTAGAFVFLNTGHLGCPAPHCGGPEPQTNLWQRVRVPIGNMTESSGIFSLACKSPKDFGDTFDCRWIVAVGGDYKHPDSRSNTAAFSVDKGFHWTASTTPPHGYRSAVAYDSKTKTWITVGPNGTDISTDDGRNWHPPQTRPRLQRHPRRRPALERPLAPLRRRPPRTHRHPPPHSFDIAGQIATLPKACHLDRSAAKWRDPCILLGPPGTPSGARTPILPASPRTPHPFQPKNQPGPHARRDKTILRPHRLLYRQTHNSTTHPRGASRCLCSRCVRSHS